MKVLCTNDRPYVVLPEGTTEKEANEVCKRLNDLDEAYCRHKEITGSPEKRVYYHWRECAVMEPNKIKLWGNREQQSSR